MASIQLSPGVLDDLERIVDHLQQHEVLAAGERVAAIIGAFDVLASSPLIGRPAGNDMRELLVGRGAQGYVALYRWMAVIDTVLVLAIRAQREAGYVRAEDPAGSGDVA